MALSATFTANFSSFYAAVEKADVKLKDFGAGADKVGGQLQKMGDRFSGVKIIQEATIMAEAVERIGGVSKLTAKELEQLGAKANEAVAKMKLMGIGVPPNLQAIADKAKAATTQTSQLTSAMSTMKGVLGAFGVSLGISTIVSFTKSVFQAADQITDLSTKMGVSVEAAQRFQYAARQSGAEIDDVSAAILKMSNGLAEGDKSTVAALDQVGLKFADIRAMKPEAAFRAVADAIGAMPDPMTQAQVAMDLFGKAGATILPMIRDGSLKAADAIQVMSDDTVRRLAAAEQSWKDFWDAVVIGTGEAIVGIADLDDAFAALFRRLNTWEGLGNVFKGLGRQMAMGLDPATSLVREALLAGEQDKKRDINLPGAPGKTPPVMDAAALAAAAKAKAAALAIEQAYQAWKRGMLGLSDEARRLNENLKRLAHEGYTDVVAKTLKINDELPAFIRQTALGSKELTKLGDEAANAAMKLKAVEQVQKSMSLIKPTDWGKLLGGAIAGDALAKGVRERAIAIADMLKFNKQLDIAAHLIDVVASAAQGGFRRVMGVVQVASRAVFDFASALKIVDQKQREVALSAATMNAGMSMATMGLTAVIDDINQGIAEHQAALKRLAGLQQQLRDEFGLTAAEIKALNKQYREANNLKGFGLANQTEKLLARLRDAQEAIDGLSGATVAFGGVVPKALRPAIAEFLKMTGLPAQMRDQLAAFAEAPGWQHLQQRAEELGIDLAALGGGFNQKRVASLGFGFFRDIEMFMEQGADLDGLLRGMSDELSRLAGEALKTGTILPKSLEPYMKRLQEMGLLVDENGNAINDLSFADMEDESLKAVVAVLEQIRELLAKALPQAAATFGAAADQHLFRERTGASSTLTGGGSAWAPAAAGAGGMMTVIVEADGRQLSRIVAPYLPDEVRRLGLARG